MVVYQEIELRLVPCCPTLEQSASALEMTKGQKGRRTLGF